jgi:hypothetical protein
MKSGKHPVQQLKQHYQNRTIFGLSKKKNHLYLRIYHSVPQQAVTPQASRRSKKKNNGRHERTTTDTHLAGEEANAAAVGFLVDADEKDGADLERKEAESVDVASESGFFDALNALRVQHRVLARRQAHVLRCRRKQAGIYFRPPLYQRSRRDRVRGEQGRKETGTEWAVELLDGDGLGTAGDEARLGAGRRRDGG